MLVGKLNMWSSFLLKGRGSTAWRYGIPRGRQWRLARGIAKAQEGGSRVLTTSAGGCRTPRRPQQEGAQANDLPKNTRSVLWDGSRRFLMPLFRAVRTKASQL